MDEALGSLQSAFQDYMISASPSDLPRIQKVCRSLGQSWDDVVLSWQSTSNVTAQYGNVTAGIDPMKQYAWYIEALTGVAQVRTIATAYAREHIFTATLAISRVAKRPHPEPVHSIHLQ